MALAGAVLARLSLAALLGGMLFFAAIMAPLVFTRLPADIAGPFIRAAFPRYYLYLGVAAAVGVLGFALRGRAAPALVLLAVLLVTVWLRLWLMPHLDAWRVAGRSTAFQRGHSLSVWINFAQFAAALWVYLRTV